MPEFVSKCNLCGGRQWRLMHAYLVPARFGKGEGVFNLMECEGCGLVHLSPRPSKQEMGHFYPDAFYATLSPESSRAKRRPLALWYNRLFPSGNLQRMRAAVGMLERVAGTGPGRLLDVGAGEGAFLEQMASRGWEVEGTDLSPEAARLTSQRLNIDIHVGSFEDMALGARRFDVITFWDVLEHLFEPREALELAHRYLVPGGRILVSVPNLRSPEARLMGREWPHLDVPRHLHHFTACTLKRMLLATGFRDVQCTTDARILSDNLPRLLLPGRQAMDGWNSGTGAYARRIVDDSLGKSLAPLRRVLGRTGLGPGLVAWGRC